MSMLAEKKTKQKWSNDPRNTAWTNDTSRFGYQMLTKMGWESGKGLGANEDGATTHVKATKRRDNLGLGADKSNEDNWLSHQMAFDDLLSKLNDNTESGIGEGKPKGKAKKHDMEKTARQSRKRVFYNRFIQSKDLSSKSAEDMACIFGQRSKSAPGTPQDYSEGEESDASTSSCPPPAIHGVKTIDSGQSIQEYFEKKMKEIKAAREGKAAGQEMNKKEQASADEIQGNNSANPENCAKESKLRKKKKEKRRKRKFSTENPEPQSEEVSTEVDKDERSAKKKKKNEDFDVKLEESEDIVIVQEARKVEKKNRKRKEKNAKMTDSEICDVDVIQSDSKECSTMKDVKPIKEKDKSCKNKDKNICHVEKSAIKDKKVKLEKPRDISEEEESKNNNGKKGKKDKNCISHDLANVEFVAKKDRKKKKKKDKSKEGKKRA